MKGQYTETRTDFGDLEVVIFFLHQRELFLFAVPLYLSAVQCSYLFAPVYKPFRPIGTVSCSTESELKFTENWLKNKPTRKRSI